MKIKIDMSEEPFSDTPTAEEMGVSDFVPLVNLEEEIMLGNEEVPESLPILPLRNNVLFPGLMLPIAVSRGKSIQLIEIAEKKHSPIGVFAQKDENNENPGIDDLQGIGTMAEILKTLKMPGGNTLLILQGKRRIRLGNIVQTEPYMLAEVTPYQDIKRKTREYVTKREEAVIEAIRESFKNMLKFSSNLPKEAGFAVDNMMAPNTLVFFITSVINIPTKSKQKILESTKLFDRAARLLAHLDYELQALELKNKIESKVRIELDKQQKEYILGQQLKAIQDEIGDSPVDKDVKFLKDKAAKKKWSKEVKEIFDSALLKLERTHLMSPEYAVQYNYLSLFTDLPWDKYSKDSFDLTKAKKVLDGDHFGLEKVKERILSYLAVLKLRGDMKAPILCLYGPPGVGKTSLGKSIAKAMSRKYVRISLGGLRDESEIRGHRRTYIGAETGQILKNMVKAGTSNPVFVLDEIDKVAGMNYNGDPSSALLEVLDPEQNTAFHDNFLEVDYDLSKVLFIATANDISSIPHALLDRMELIEVSGYAAEEKVQIAKKHLIPKQLKEHGLKNGEIKFPESVVEYIISSYTRESGVRLLEKRIAEVVRSCARAWVEENTKELKKRQSVNVDNVFVRKSLGLETARYDARLKSDAVGVVAGLSWSTTGGDLLFIESSISKGTGQLTLTGNLGMVMKESATLAYEYIKSNAKNLGVDWSVVSESDIYVHVPEGAIPKDGPSGGIALFTSMLSVFTDKKVRADVAMTGEITLRGQVLPVGGVREKILAAKRGDIRTIILSEENKPQIEEIPERYKKDMVFYYVNKVDEVHKHALVEKHTKTYKKK